MKFSLTILGSNSAVPGNGRHPTSQVLNIQEQLYLIDCGEATQIRMNDFRVKRNKINQIFISHFHGDHIFGLPGLLGSYSLAGRKEPMEIFSPPGLKAMMDVIAKTSGWHQTYEIIYHEVNPEENRLIFENKKIEVYTIPLIHRMPTCGYFFVEKPHARGFRAEKIEEYGIPFSKINDIKKGADLELKNGQIISNSELTTPPKKSRAYAYCSDTAYNEAIIPMIKNVDLLYHESTFGKALAELAAPRGHSTVEEAATIAKKANVGQLVLGHFSTRYDDLEPLLAEAKPIFENSYLGIEGKTFEVSF